MTFQQCPLLGVKLTLGFPKLPLWRGVLRNALAHGGIVYLNSDGRSSLPLSLMYVFKTSAYIPPRFPFDKIMRGVVTNKFDRAFRKQMTRALRTAR